jgi:S-DNA-T family DNA segregation ATPase FtsK/SpoIIIE
VQLRLSVNQNGGTATDLLIDADPGVSVDGLAEQIGRTLGAPTAPALYLDGVHLDPATALGDSPIRDGVVLGVGTPARAPDQLGPGVFEVRVVGGPGAGEVHRLGPGSYPIGGTAKDWIRLLDTEIAAGALTVEVSDTGVAIVTADGGTEATLESAPVGGVTPWPTGHLLAVGKVLLEAALPEFPDAALHLSEDGGGLDYSRPPRLAPPERKNSFALPAAPKAHEKRPLPWVMAIVPLIGAVALAAVTKQTTFLALALLSPISMMANHFNERRTGKQSYARTVEEYQRRRNAIVADAEEALAAEQAARRANCPDPALVVLLATGPRQRLWERRHFDPDCGLIRLGTGELPSEVVLTDPDVEEHRRREPLPMNDVPITVPLRQYGVLGLAGRIADVRALACWVVAQSAVLHSPTDLGICVLAEPAAAPTWGWVRWLPHARPRSGQEALALLGTSTQSVAQRVAELNALLTDRQEELRRAGPTGRLNVPDVLVVIDGSRRLRSLPGVPQLLEHGPSVGIHLVCLESEGRFLPEECKAVGIISQNGNLSMRLSGAEGIMTIRPDLVTPAWCERAARALAALRDVSHDDDATLPDAARLLDVLGLASPTAERIASGWATGGISTRAVVGISLDGPFALDLRRDGPHGLIAGTTGSGKSELLQTIVASLAVANRPDAMTFVLVDYKGGSAFAECARLPHTVGMVTDLDAGLVRRALDSLVAELQRREHTLAAAKAKDLEAYLDARRRDPSLAPMPRLVIVIDEFATLVRELPDFVTGLVNIAQRGRSLGIHLLLATQRPSGVVSPEIRANTNLRIALRVTDASESSDVIETPDAARIPKSAPGRAYVRLGAAALVPFQTARVGGKAPGRRAVDAPPPFVKALAPAEFGDAAPRRPQEVATDETPVTDLAELVDAISEAAEQLGLANQPSPWLAPLPTQVTVAELDSLLEPRAGSLRPAPFALVDLPDTQSRQADCIDLATFGHLFVAGSPRTGRSQALRTIAGSLAARNSAADVHLFGIDCGNGALLPLGGLAHCGAVVRAAETERVERLLGKFADAAQARMHLLGEQNVTDIGEQRASVSRLQRLPHLVLLIDRWDGFVASLGDRDGGALVDRVMRLAREGAALGIHLIISGDQTLLGGRMGSLTDRKIVLALADRGDFGLIGINPRTVPDHLPPGRCYRTPGGAEAQIALLDADPSGAAQAEALARVAAEARERDGELPEELQPFAVDVLPTHITWEAAWQLRQAGNAPGWALIGVGGDRLAAVGADLLDGTPAFLVGGPPRSGRSTALLSVARSCLATGIRVLVATPRPSPLSGLGGRDGVVAVAADVNPAVLRDAIAAGGPLAVLVDDAELLRDSAASSELSDIVRRMYPSVAVVAAGDPDGLGTGFSGWQVEARRARRGLLLSPQNLADADLIGVRIARTAIGNPIEPGRGLLHLGDGQLLTVQVPRA